MHHKAAFLIAVVILAGAISAGEVHAATSKYSPPLQQQMNGVPVDAIQCNAPRELYLMNSMTPVCIYASTYQTLLERGTDLAPYQSFARTVYLITDAGEMEVQRVVEETVHMYESDKENALANVNGLSENIVVHYPFILDPDTKNIVAHGASPDRVDTRSTILGNYADKPYSVIVDELQDGDGTWVDYVFLDPTTGEDGLKRSWLVLHDGYIFGAGFYYSLEEKIYRVIDDAIALYEADGGFDGINTLHTSPDAHYPLVIDPAASMVVAHGAFPEQVGPALVPQDASFMEMADALANGDRVVQHLSFKNPINGEDGQKILLFKLHDGYLFMAGYYYPASEKVISVVEDTIRMYESDKDNAFASIGTLSENVDPHYPFVVDPNTGNIVAHGAFPGNVGTASVILGGYADRPSEDILSDLKDGGGTWVEYQYRIPGTDFEEKKRSYLQMHDGYVFGSGYYFSVFTVISPN